jgi:hypothetical protein
MRLDLKFRSLWRLLRAKAARINKLIGNIDDQDMIFQVPSSKKKFLDKEGPPVSSGVNIDEGAK